MSKVMTAADDAIAKDSVRYVIEWRKRGNKVTPIAVEASKYNAKRDMLAAVKAGETFGSNIGDVMDSEPKIVRSPKKTKTKAPRKTRPKKGVADRKKVAFEMFEDGHGVSAVAAELDITYGNAHYYKRCYDKGVK